MDKLSGLVLDYYDDRNGHVLKTVFPTLSSVPTIIKEAHRLTHEERLRMPDDTFAVIISDGDVTLRKYSMADRGNTALSVEYFLKTGHKLPLEAQKVAAVNLVDACRYFDLDPPETLQKVALGFLGMFNAATVLPGAAREASNNLKAARTAGSAIMTPQQLQARKMQMMGAPQ